jgi:hypothetical protein
VVRIAVGLIALLALGGQPAALGAPSPASHASMRAQAIGPTMISMALDTRSSRIFIAHARSTSVFDTRSGTLLRTLPVGGLAVAVDERTGHAFVAR